MGAELNLYKSRIDAQIPNLEDLQTINTRLGYLITVGSTVVGKLKDAEETADKVDKGILNAENLLKVLGFVSPLKTPVNIMKRVLDNVEKPVDRIDDKFDELDGKDDTSTPGREGDGQFLQRLENGLNNANLVQGGVADTLTLQLRKLELTSEAMGHFQATLPAALRGGELWSASYIALNAAIESQLGARNDAAAGIQALYNNVKADVDAFLDTLETVDFEGVFGGVVDMDSIKGIFDFLDKPLEIAAAVIRPIQPLLNAIDFFIGLIVNPIIDFIIDALGIDDLIEGVSDQITSLLPAIGFLDPLVEFAQQLQNYLLDFVNDALGMNPYLDLIETAFFGDAVGNAALGPTGWGSDIPNIIQGNDGDNIIDGLGGRDILLGGGGNDVIIAGTGSDVINGGAGEDLIYFNASFTQYELSRDRLTGDIVVSHLLPVDPQASTGIDMLLGLEDDDHVVFTDISFTGAELKNALIDGSVLNGNSDDNLMFLNSDGTPVNGYHVANGFAGDDRIFGSTQNDRLNGGSGNDVLIPGFGDDIADGGAGWDTYQALAGLNRQFRIDLLAGTSFGAGRDTLESIENLIISPDQKHKIKGSDLTNIIFTGDEIDVISGLGGDDIIDTGGQDDFVVAGAGSDIVLAGEGRDSMVSGSAAEAGVSDLYDGGDGYDAVAYTSEHNTILFEFNNEGDDPSIGQELKNYMEGQPDSGPVEINGTTGEIRRFDFQGRYVSTDYTENVEGFIGSDKADVLYGGPVADLLHGAGGDDVIWTGGTENINGGDGDDTIHAQNVDGGATSLQIYGGAGFDVLNLDQVGDARWYYQINTAIALTLRAHRTTVEGEDLRNVPGALFSIKPYELEEINLGNYADHVIYEPGGTSTAFFNLMGGDDRFDAENGFVDVDAGAGNDIGNFDGGGSGIFRARAGDDYAVFNDTDDRNIALMSTGEDYVLLERFRGHANGGSGYDTLAFDVSFNSRIVADLQAGTVNSFKNDPRNISEQIQDATFEKFEEYIATEFNDLIDGSSRAEQVLGRGGNDVIRGLGGNDKLYGGAGNDALDGGNGDDLLHGGPGNDTLNGGAGNDTISYAWVRPGGLDGKLFAGNFGGVTVSLPHTSATGAFGSDTLTSIENVFGSGGDDTLTGNGQDNTLSGEDGDDTLVGNGGNDILVTGRGTDFASGGAGNDTVVVGIGIKTLNGGAGFDTLDFGTVDGLVNIDFRTGVYEATFLDEVPRWTIRDRDGDGIEESDGTEARAFNGVFMTPQDVFEADPFNSNDPGDTARVLPADGDPLFEDFLIRMAPVDVASSGGFGQFEQVVGGTSGANIVLTETVERFDGRNSARDVIDLSNSAQNITYNFRNGANNVSVLVGDVISDIEGLRGGTGDDNVTGDGNDNMLWGGGGADVMVGSGGFDEMHGDAGDDALNGGYDRDIVRGGAGHDRVFGAHGNDGLYGDAGDDEIHGGEGDDWISGGGGNDTASYRYATGAVTVDLNHSGRDVGGGEGRDSFSSIENLEGSDFEDTLTGTAGANTLIGGAMRDVLWGLAGNDTLYGGGGNDSLRAGSGNDLLMGQNGDDYLLGNRGNDILMGGTGDDTLNGGGGLDTASYVYAGGGVYADLRWSGRDVGGGQGVETFQSIENLTGSSHGDRLAGDASANVLEGGAGDDILKGFGGGDRYDGGAGNDLLFGWEGDDVMAGGDGDDILLGLAGVDELVGNAGSDYLYGGRDADLLQGGNGNDFLRGNLGNDLLSGGQGSDDLRGGGSNDTLRGDGGDDFLLGENGSDTLDGGAGNDVLRGGAGGSEGDGFRDIFVFGPANGLDGIKDFENGLDQLDLTALDFANFGAVRAIAEERAFGLKLVFAEGNEVFIDGLTLAQFTSDDVLT